MIECAVDQAFFVPFESRLAAHSPTEIVHAPEREEAGQEQRKSPMLTGQRKDHGPRKQQHDARHHEVDGATTQRRPEFLENVDWVRVHVEGRS